MLRHSLKLFILVVALLTLAPSIDGKGGRGGHSSHSSHSSHSGGHSGGSHSYPSSGGLSGGGHSSSGGLSGGGHGYPSSGGGSHGYPSSGGGLSGGGHGYPSSGGGLSGGGRGYPSSGGTHTMPGGSHGYPANKGVSGNYGGSSTTVHHHYHYSPPSQIRYSYGGSSVVYPVYQGPPPVYIYEYKNSGSRYSDLLTGLALYNLGSMSARSHSHSYTTYTPQSGEVCYFEIRKDNGEYEKTKINCEIVSSFAFQEPAAAIPQKTGNNVTMVTTTTVTNITTVNGAPANAPQANVSTMLPDGRLVAINATTANVTNPMNNTITSSVTTTTTNTTTVKEALEVKGTPIQVTPQMQCFIVKTTPSSSRRQSVPCGVLQTYARESLRKNSASHLAPTMTMASVVIMLLVVR